MKLLIIALAIAAAGGCGHEAQSDNGGATTSRAVQPAAPAAPQHMDSATGTVPVAGSRTQAPGEPPPPPPDPNRIDPQHPPKERPVTPVKPEVVDFRK